MQFTDMTDGQVYEAYVLARLLPSMSLLNWLRTGDATMKIYVTKAGNPVDGYLDYIHGETKIEFHDDMWEVIMLAAWFMIDGISEPGEVDA